jgi:4-hydroxybenzoate polyprenyltransferase
LRNKIVAFYKLMRLDKPVGIFLLLWPTLWALFLASNALPDLKLLSIFIAGSILMRSAGCVINDYFDRKIDPQVQRTKNRQIGLGNVTLYEVFFIVLALSLTSFILVLQLNLLSMQVAFIAFLFVISYPLTKRFFCMPQLYLGVTFGFGILIAFSAVQNQIPSQAFLLFAANIFWAIAYDSHYAVSDMSDDRALNIYSVPLTFKGLTIKIIFISYLLMFFILYVIGFIEQFSYQYYLALLIAIFIALYNCNLSKKLNSEKNFKAFLLNNYLGCFIFLGFLSQT